MTVIEPLQAVAAPVKDAATAAEETESGGSGEEEEAAVVVDDGEGEERCDLASLAASTPRSLASSLGGSGRHTSKIPVSARSGTPRRRSVASEASQLDWDSWLTQAAEKARSPQPPMSASPAGRVERASPPLTVPQQRAVAPTPTSLAPARAPAMPPTPLAPAASPPPLPGAPPAVMRMRDETTNEEIEVDPVQLCSALMAMHREMKAKEGQMLARIGELEGMLASVFPELRSHTHAAGKGA